MKKGFVLVFVALLAVFGAFGSQNSLGVPHSKGVEDDFVEFSQHQKDTLDSLFNFMVDDGYFPGAQLYIGNSKGVIYSQNYGFSTYSKQIKVDDNSLYDLASCTKIFATTLAVMVAVQDEKVGLKQTIGEILPQYCDEKFSSVTLKELLFHTSGFNPTVWIAGRLSASADEKIDYISGKKSKTNPYLFAPDHWICKKLVYDSNYISTKPSPTNFAISQSLFLEDSFKVVVDSMVCEAFVEENRGLMQYSDLNFYMIKKIVERSCGSDIRDIINPIYQKVGADRLGYLPLEWAQKEEIMPTETNPSFRRDTLRGYVHDDFAAADSGVAGNAGLFGSAKSVAMLCELFLNMGVDGEGEQILSEAIIKEFTKYRKSKNGGVRGLGFDKNNPEKTPYSKEGYGHAGYTGTYFWIDPERDIYMVILSNRVYTTRCNTKFSPKTRADLWKRIITPTL